MASKTDYAKLYWLLTLATFLWHMNGMQRHADDFLIQARDRRN